MSWEMYQLFYSESSELRPGPRFKLLKDALAHAIRHCDGRSFAIRTPEGKWHRDDQGRSIFGRGGSGSYKVMERSREQLAMPDFDEEDTQPFGAGSGSHRTSNSRKVAGTGPVEKVSNVTWPPDSK